MDILITNPKVIWRKEDTSYILFNPLNDEIVVLNESGFALWQACEGVSKRALLDGISQNVGKAAAEASRVTIESLVSLGFLEVKP